MWSRTIMSDLQKSIGVVRGTAMMLNIVLGAGLLTLPGLAAMTVGAAAPMVWVACMLVAAPLLVVFGILGRRYPDAGGVASIMDVAFGPCGRVAATFLFFGAVMLGLPAIAITGGHYAAAVLGGSAHLYAILLILSAVAVNLLSVELAGRVNALAASVVLVFIIVIAVVGWLAVKPAWEDLAVAPGRLPDLATFGLAFMMVFFAFTGWEVSANLNGEFRNPRRDLPLALAFSFIVAVGLYFTLAFVVAGAGADGANEAPFARIFRAQFGVAGAASVSAVSVLLILANLSAAVWAVSRMVFAAARERLLPAPLAALRAGLPIHAVFMTLAVLLAVVLLAAEGVFDLGTLLAYAGQAFLLLYAGAAASLVRLSERRWQSILGVICLAICGMLALGRGINHMLYPATLIFAGLLVAVLQRRRMQPT